MENEIVEGDGFYVSYNPGGDSFLVPTCETALVVPREDSSGKNDFFILYGDFREQYSDLITKGLGDCLKFFDKMKGKHMSLWSNDTEGGR